MTNSDPVNDEEGFLVDQLNGARHKLATVVAEKGRSKREWDKKQLEAEKQLEEIETALVDYCKGNGLIGFETQLHDIRIGETESVDVPNIEAIPEEYIRTKVTKEANKILIREKRPVGNWYSMVKRTKVTVSNK